MWHSRPRLWSTDRSKSHIRLAAEHSRGRLCHITHHVSRILAITSCFNRRKLSHT
jgi:hypothetical protein